MTVMMMRAHASLMRFFCVLCMPEEDGVAARIASSAPRLAYPALNGPGERSRVSPFTRGVDTAAATCRIRD